MNYDRIIMLTFLDNLKWDVPSFIFSWIALHYVIVGLGQITGITWIFSYNAFSSTIFGIIEPRDSMSAALFSTPGMCRVLRSK